MPFFKKKTFIAIQVFVFIEKKKSKKKKTELTCLCGVPSKCGGKNCYVQKKTFANHKIFCCIYSLGTVSCYYIYY